MPYKVARFIDFAVESIDAFDPGGLTMVHEDTFGAPPSRSRTAGWNAVPKPPSGP